MRDTRSAQTNGSGPLGAESNGGCGSAISRRDIEAQLGRILASPDFDATDRNRRFLQFIVIECLEGRADRLKAYAIAVEVFGRSAAFDAQNDPIVRMEAAKLRKALEYYYATAGREDSVRIAIPKGHYVPTFEDSSPDAPAATGGQHLHWWQARPLVTGAALLLLLAAAAVVTRWPIAWFQPETGAAVTVASDRPYTPRVVVTPLRDLTGTPASETIAAGLTEELIGELARFHEIEVIVADPLRPAASETPDGRYALDGSVRVDGGQIRLLARLTDRRDGAVLWSDSYDNSLQVRPLLEVQSDIASKVATVLAQPYGIIFSADPKQRTDPEDWPSYSCVLSYYTYRRLLDPASHRAVQACLETVVARYPDYATAWALLSLTLVDEGRFRFYVKPDHPPDFARAVEAATRAVELDPANVRGLEAEMLARFFAGQREAALEIGRRAVEVNPNDTELVGAYGIRRAFYGDWDAGCPLVEQSLERNLSPHTVYQIALAVCAYMQGDYSAAEAWIRAANVEDNPNPHFVAAAAYGQLGATGDAEREVEWITEHASALLGNIHSEFLVRFGRPEDRQHFLEGLKKAGLKLPQS